MRENGHDWLWYARFANAATRLEEFKPCIGVVQNSHHQHDVSNHCQITASRCYQISADNTLAAAGMIHDFAKPATAKPYLDQSNKQRNRFPNHATYGKKLVLEMDPLFFEHWEIDQAYIADMVGIHSIPIDFIKSVRGKSGKHHLQKQQYPFLEETILSRLEKNPVNVEDALTLFLADTYAKGYPGKNQDLVLFSEYLYRKHIDGRLEPLKHK